jgi:hypothetical protein
MQMGMRTSRNVGGVADMLPSELPEEVQRALAPLMPVLSCCRPVARQVGVLRAVVR